MMWRFVRTRNDWTGRTRLPEAGSSARGSSQPLCRAQSSAVVSGKKPRGSKSLQIDSTTRWMSIRPICIRGLPWLAERLDAGHGAPEDERVDVVRALVGIHHFQVDEVARDAELIRDAVAAHHVARHARDVERLAAGIPLQDRGDLDRRRALVLHASQAQAPL